MDFEVDRPSPADSPPGDLLITMVKETVILYKRVLKNEKGETFSSLIDLKVMKTLLTARLPATVNRANEVIYSKIRCRRTHVLRGQAGRSYLQAAFLSGSYIVQCREQWAKILQNTDVLRSGWNVLVISGWTFFGNTTVLRRPILLYMYTSFRQEAHSYPQADI